MCIGFFQKGEVSGVEEGNSRDRQEKIKFTDLINKLYNELLQLGYLYKDLYEMDLKELENVLEQRKKGLAYNLWKQAMLNTFVRDPEQFPKTPEDASPELYPPPKTYKMPEFLKNAKKERR